MGGAKQRRLKKEKKVAEKIGMTVNDYRKYKSVVRQVPPEIWSIILSNLPSTVLRKIAETCKPFHQISKDILKIRKLHEKYCPIISDDHGSDDDYFYYDLLDDDPFR